ncbi:MAG TPA: S-layer homology domain-containing protein, partial [Candidatus Gracilibacteria bacterium]|nr:S-layer homology domain-containing protein [Candidatus Gracilibacteria bacterium]
VGTILYGGDCTSPSTDTVLGDNTLTFNALALGTHDNCTIQVRDAANNLSNILNIPEFTITEIADNDLTPPLITQISPVASPSSDTTPNYVFNTNEVGTILYGGDCTSPSTNAILGDNTVTFNALSVGIHNNCTIQVRDSANNLSNILNIPAFTIQSVSSGGGSGGGSGSGGGGFWQSPKNNTPITYSIQSVNQAEETKMVIKTKIRKKISSKGIFLKFFRDSKNHWSKNYIKDIYEKIALDKRLNFYPNRDTNRAEIAKMIVKAFEFEISPAKKSVFSDVDKNHWASPYINTLSDLGIVTGYHDGKFYPAKKVNRAEAIKMVSLAAKISPQSGKSNFRDVLSNKWYAPYINAAYSKKFVQGRTPYRFYPQDYITRGEIAKILSIASEYVLTNDQNE